MSNDDDRDAFTLTVSKNDLNEIFFFLYSSIFRHNQSKLIQFISSRRSWKRNLWLLAMIVKMAHLNRLIVCYVSQLNMECRAKGTKP